MLPAAATVPIVPTKARYNHNKKISTRKMSVGNLQPLEGKLSKYTNVVKGWQNRYFIVNVSSGVLEYHISQSDRLTRPRGAINLAGSVIAPSSEDSYTFSVNSTNGDVFKLRASDARQRQQWVSNLRTVANHFTKQIAQEHPPIMMYTPQQEERTRSRSMVSNLGHKIKDAADQVQQKTVIGIENIAKKIPTEGKESHNSQSVRYENKPTHNKPQVNISTTNATMQSQKELRNVKEALYTADNLHTNLTSLLEKLPRNQTGLKPDEKQPALTATDRDVLMLKATSAATLQCLASCYSILNQHQQHYKPSISMGASLPQYFEHSDKESIHSVGSSTTIETIQQFDPAELKEIDVNISPADEEQDKNVMQEADLGTVEKHKSVIMHLLSQLKLGMDLTRVTLPTFILEKRSLLEMYADFIALPELFIRIADGTTPKQRMLNVVKFYLLSFHCGREGAMAKKPYNPILGETFHCSYYVPKKTSNVPYNCEQLPPMDQCDRIRFTAEQVSHHPPVSAFHAECPARNITMTSHIWTKSKFMNMSIGVHNIGEAVIHLPEHDEKYIVTFPAAFARSILTTPWVELGGRCSITCPETNHAASIVFHTKPMYGGSPHKVSGSVRDEDGVYCQVEGEWNGVLKLIKIMEEASQKAPNQTELIDVTLYKSQKKFVRPFNKQSQMESRNLWQHVTKALQSNEINEATNHKNTLETQQRNKEAERVNCHQPVHNKLFRKVDESYVYVTSK